MIYLKCSIILIKIKMYADDVTKYAIADNANDQN